MSENLGFNIEVTGVQDLDKLAQTVDKLTGVLNSSRGSGKSLEEMRKILVGMKGQSSVFQDMKTAIEELNNSAKTLKDTFKGQISQLGKVLKSEMEQLRAVIANSGTEIGKATEVSVAKSLGAVETQVQKSFRSISAKAKAEATKMYQDLANYDPKAKFKDINVLISLKDAGATLSPFHAMQVKMQQDAEAVSVKGFEKVRKLMEAEQKSSLDKMGEAQKRAMEEDIAGWKQMLKLKVAAEGVAAKERLAIEKALNDKIAANKLASDRQMFANFDSSLGIGRKPTPRSNFSFQDAPASVDPSGKGKKEAVELAGAWDRLNISGNNLHSMARGLASGFNLLWLTWGNIAPLLAGAALSTAFVQTAKQGMEVAHTMEIIAVLGEATAEEIRLLNSELSRLAMQGPFGPLQIAEAMKTLSLAGLKANEVLAVTQDVLNFSVAGTTDLKTAADTLVSVSTAFGLGAEGFSRVADVITKASAISMTSVEAFSGAMRQATVVNSQYGVSLEDTATGITALANIGIQASAAGTAFRNMYADLSGRSKKVEAVISSLGLKIRDSVTGGFRPMLEVVAELNEKLLQMSAIDAKNVIQQLFSERGGKPIVEMLRLIQTEAKGAGSGLANELARIRKEIDESYGMAAISAARLSQTLQSQFKGVGAALQNSMYTAYQSVEPILWLTASAAKEAFNSPEFVSGLTELVRLMSSVVTVLVKFTAFLVEHSTATLAVVGAYTLWRVGLGITISMQATAAAALVADTAATEANTIAKAKNAAVSRAGALANLTSLGKVGAVLAVVAAGWMLYEYLQSKSGDASKEAAEKHSQGIIKALDEEAKKLERINELNLQGLTIGDAKKRQAEEAAAREQLQPEEDFLGKAKERERRAFQRLSNLPDITPSTNLAARALTEKNLKKELDEASAAVDSSIKRVGAQMGAVDRVREQAKRVSDAEQKELAEKLKASGALFKGLEAAPDMSGGGGASDPRGLIEKDNTLKNLERRLNDETALLKAAYDDQAQILDNKLQNEIINRGEHQARLLLLTASYEAENLAVVKKGLEDYASSYDTTYKEIEAKKRASPVGSQAYKDYDAALQAMREERLTFEQTQNSKIEKLESDSLKRRTIAANNYYGEIAKLKKADAEFWEKDTRDTERERALKALEESYANINTSLFSTAEAEKAQALETRKATDAYLEKTEAIKEQIKLERQRLAALQDALVFSNLMAGDAGNPVAEELLTNIAQREGAIAELSNLLETSTAEALRRGAEKGFEAYRDVMKQKRDALVNGVADAIDTAIFEGGKAGRVKLRKLLVDELLRKPFMMQVKVLLQPIMGAIVGALFGGGGGGGAVAQAGSAAGGAGSILNMGSSAYSAYTGMTSGTGFWGGVGSSLGVHSSSAATAGIAMEGGAGVGAAAAPGGFMANLGAAMPWIAGGLAVASALGLFRKTKTVGSGITGELGGKDSLRSYDLRRKSGYLFGGPSYSIRDTGELEGSKAIQDAYLGMRKNTVDMAKSLGLDTTKIENFTTQIGTQIHPDTGKQQGLDLTGLSQEQAQAKISEALKTANNEMAQQILGSWEDTVTETTRRVNEIVRDPNAYDDTIQQTRDVISKETVRTYKPSEFAKEGETAIETLTRLATSLGTVNAVFDSLGQTLFESSLKGGDLASKLIDAFGDIEKFTKATSYYFDNFYSDEEKRAVALRQLGKTFKDKGLDLPKTKEEYRALVESQDLSTEAGRKMYAFLLELAPAFTAVGDAARQAAEAAATAARDTRDKALAALEKAVAKEKELLDKKISQQQDLISKLTSLFDFLDKSIKELYSEVSSTAKASASTGTANINAMLATALSGGGLPDQKALEEAYSAVRGQMSMDNYASVIDFEKDKLVLAGKLSQLRDLTEDQLTDAQKTLKELEAQSLKLDETLDYWKKQIEIANGTYEAILTVEEAIRGLREATAKPMDKIPGTFKPDFVIGGGNAVTGGSTPRSAGKDASGRYVTENYLGSYGSSYAAVSDAEQSRLESLQKIYDQASSSGGSVADAFRALFGAGASLTDIGALSGFNYTDLADAARRAGVNSFAVGTNYVPEDQLAFVHKGEAIVPAEYNPENGNMTESMVLEILSRELAKMNENLALNLIETVKISKAVNGNPEQPTPVTLV